LSEAKKNKKSKDEKNWFDHKVFAVLFFFQQFYDWRKFIEYRDWFVCKLESGKTFFLEYLFLLTSVNFFVSYTTN
jgi:hypothetical protein